MLVYQRVNNDEDSLPFVTSKSMVLFLMFFFPSETWNDCEKPTGLG
jgi:hypothetical protein